MKSPQARAMGKACYLGAHPAVDPILHQLNQELRQHAGNITEVCEEAGVYINTVRRWMKGRSAPTLPCLQALAQRLGYTLVLRKDTP